VYKLYVDDRDGVLPSDYIQKNAIKFIEDLVHELLDASDLKLLNVKNNVLTFSFKSKQTYGHIRDEMNDVHTDHEPWYFGGKKTYNGLHTIISGSEKIVSGGEVLFLGSPGGPNMI